MGGKGGGFISRLFDKDSWKGTNSFLQNVFDPGAILNDMETGDPKKLKPPVDEDAIEASAEAGERERRRLAGLGRSTVLSGRRADALSASIGKRTLGGTM